MDGLHVSRRLARTIRSGRFTTTINQAFPDVMRVVDTNVTGTLYLVHKVGREMRDRPPVLAPVGGRHLSPAHVRHPLHSVAEPQHGHAERAGIGPRQRRSLVVDALRPARKDDARGVPAPDPLFGLVGREHDGEDPRVADSPCNQLRVLAAEIEDDDRTAGRRHETLAREITAAGAARSDAGTIAAAAPRNGASATMTGVTSAPGA